MSVLSYFPPKVASAVAEMVVARPEIGSLIVDVMCLSDLETMSKKVKTLSNCDVQW